VMAEVYHLVAAGVQNRSSPACSRWAQDKNLAPNPVGTGARHNLASCSQLASRLRSHGVELLDDGLRPVPEGKRR
jgi:hypothetical protein